MLSSSDKEAQRLVVWITDAIGGPTCQWYYILSGSLASSVLHVFLFCVMTVVTDF